MYCPLRTALCTRAFTQASSIRIENKKSFVDIKSVLVVKHVEI